MTCIAAVVHNDLVYMGGDSASIDGTALVVRADQKVFRNGEFLIGFCGSLRMGQLLRYALVPPKHPRRVDTYRYMVTDFIDAVRDAFRKGGHLKSDRGEEQVGGQFLVGYRSRLYTVEDDYDVGEAVDGFASIGCAADIALGALCVSEGMDPRKRVRAALEASERYNGAVRRPFYVHVLTKDE